MTPTPIPRPLGLRFASTRGKAILTALAAICLGPTDADPVGPRSPDPQPVPATGAGGATPRRVDLGLGFGVTTLLAEFPLDQEERPGIMLPVHWNGKIYRFLLDTGCTGSVVDESLRELLGPKIETVAAESVLGASHSTDLYPAIDAKVGPLSLKDCGPVSVGDLRGLRRDGKGRDWPCDGILGMTFIGRFLWVISWDDRKLCICESLAPAEVQEARRKVVKGNDIFAHYRISIEGDGFPAVLDTGFNCPLGLDKPRFERLASAGSIQGVTSVGIDTSNGKASSNLGHLDSFSFAQGNAVHVLEKVLVSDGGRPRLGLPFLKPYYVMWDVPAQKTLLYPRAEIQKAMRERKMPVLPWPSHTPQVRVEPVAAPAPAR